MASESTPSEDLPPDVLARLLRYVEKTTDIIAVTDDKGGVVYLNEAGRERLGVGADPVTGLTTADLLAESAFDLYFEEIRPAVLRGETWTGQLQARSAHGEPVEVWTTVVGEAAPGGEVRWLVTAARDMSGWTQFHDELNRRATHDELTDLAGRALLTDRIEHALHRARRNKGHTAVMFLDLNELKAVNDGFGHHAGDEVIVEVARRLRAAVRTIDTVARIGGDEFIVLLDEIDDEDDARALATRVQAALEAEVITVGTTRVNLSASVGLAVGDGDSTPEQLLRRADADMYTVKSDRRSPGPTDESTHAIAVAVTQGSIVPHYQPVVATDTGVVVGHQALARWRQPSGAPLPASAFVGAVAATGLAFSLDLAVLRQAALDVVAAGPAPDLRLWMHLSSRSMLWAGMDRFVEDVLAGAALDPARLSIEVPGDIVTRHRAEVLDTLHSLRDLDIHLVLSGRVPEAGADLHDDLFDELRFRVPTGQGGPALLDTLAPLFERAHHRGQRIHVAGFESEVDLAHLRELGCDLVEGNRFGPVSTAPESGRR